MERSVSEGHISRGSKSSSLSQSVSSLDREEEDSLATEQSGEIVNWDGDGDGDKSDEGRLATLEKSTPEKVTETFFFFFLLFLRFF